MLSDRWVWKLELSWVQTGVCCCFGHYQLALQHLLTATFMLADLLLDSSSQMSIAIEELYWVQLAW